MRDQPPPRRLTQRGTDRLRWLRETTDPRQRRCLLKRKTTSLASKGAPSRKVSVRAGDVDRQRLDRRHGWTKVWVHQREIDFRAGIILPRGRPAGCVPVGPFLLV